MLCVHTGRWSVLGSIGATVIVSTLIACATSTDPGSRIDNGGAGDIIGPGGGDDGQGAGGTVIANPGGSGGATDASVDGRPPRPMKYDDAGNASCMNIASIGKYGAWGKNGTDDTNAFRDWLNRKSSAQVDNLTTRVPLTRELLDKYDVVILQSLGDGNQGLGPYWTFTADEQKALADWVNAGGGLLTLQGYGADAGEITPVDQLLAFTGMSYNGDTIFLEAERGANSYCWGDSVQMTSWVTSDPISSALTAHVTSVGSFHGRSINLADATVFAHTNSGSAVAAAAKKVGLGGVVVFNDEWITYTSQWQVNPATPDGQKCTNQYDPCNGKCADKMFQVPQFWYDVVAWISEASACPFVIREDDVQIR